MHKGDQFIIFNESAGPKVSTVADNITASAFPDRIAGEESDQVLTRVFTVPNDYVELRRAANAYIDGYSANVSSLLTIATPDAKALILSEELDGPLTARALNRIEDALAETDITPYIRSQPVYETDHHGHWIPLFHEFYTSITELHHDKFPKLVLRGDERMFIELCRVLDRRSVPEILRRHRAKPSNRISLNLTLASFKSPFFEKFLKDSSESERKSLVIEMNHSDLFHQPRSTLRALATLREAGFSIVLDGITLDLLAITALHRLDLDYLKVSMSNSSMSMLKDDHCVASLKKLPREKVILCQCEKDSTLPVGQAFGLNKFQGRLIDRLVSGKA
ncbi:MAG: EAL domain-containing protein [Rhodospirillaceae bacterium]